MTRLFHMRFCICRGTSLALGETHHDASQLQMDNAQLLQQELLIDGQCESWEVDQSEAEAAKARVTSSAITWRLLTQNIESWHIVGYVASALISGLTDSDWTCWFRVAVVVSVLSVVVMRVMLACDVCVCL